MDLSRLSKRFRIEDRVPRKRDHRAWKKITKVNGYNYIRQSEDVAQSGTQHQQKHVASTGVSWLEEDKGCNFSSSYLEVSTGVFGL